jgi:hypothetical protein
MYEFIDGFPESKAEFDNYLLETRKIPLKEVITDIREIKNHNLQKLLFYSWVESTIKEIYWRNGWLW